ncbi:MAG: hypothetical protein KY432_10140, partial [Acidobacteria bacterium]|nr:hypothetical protein [Acidobacteriota bacterium]
MTKPFSTRSSQWLLLFAMAACGIATSAFAEHSVARQWNEILLDAIREDLARPTVHARNLFHSSVVMYDAWAAYDDRARPFLLGNRVAGFECAFEGVGTPANLQAAREEAISYATYRLLRHRFEKSPGAETSIPKMDSFFATLGHDADFTSVDYRDGRPAALGNYIAQCMIDFGLQDGANEEDNYASLHYEPVNPPLAPELPGNPSIVDPNRWQPLAFDVFVDQAGNVIPGAVPEFIGPEWGRVVPFSLTEEDMTIYAREGHEYGVCHDPGPPPYIDPSGGGLSSEYIWGFALVSLWSSHLDPSDGVMWDISPGSIGNI